MFDISDGTVEAAVQTIESCMQKDSVLDFGGAIASAWVSREHSADNRVCASEQAGGAEGCTEAVAHVNIQELLPGFKF